MGYLCAEKGGRSGRVVRESERERMAGNETISRCSGATGTDWQQIRESELVDRERVPRIAVLWSSNGLGETKAESGSRRPDGGNSVNSAPDMIRAAKSRDGLHPEGEDERNRSLEMEAAIANPESAHGLKVKGPPNWVVLFYSDEGVLDFAILILEGKSVRFANAVEHGIDRNCDSPIA